MINSDDFLPAAYADGSIANIPATIATLLDTPFEGLPPLRPAAWQPLNGDVQRVVLVLVDALGWDLLQGARSRAGWLWQQALVQEQLTSVFPSTTVAALSSVWTGAAPAQHGLVGLRLLFPEYAVLGQMLSMGPNFISAPDALVRAGTEPADFLEVAGFAEQLAWAGVPTYAYKSYSFVDSALSQMHGRGVRESVGIVTAADMFLRVRQRLEETAGERLYISAYWHAVDTLTHMYGPDHPAVAAEVSAVLQLLQEELVSALSPAARANTVLFLTADHGQVNTPEEQEIYLDDHPALQEMLLMRPAGEPRTPYLYARQGRQADVIAYIQEHLGQAMVAMAAEEALAAGLLGPEPHAPQTALRVGDVVATMREGYVLLTPEERAQQRAQQRAQRRDKGRRMVARHGGMTPGEMAVPWFGLRLG